MCQFFGLSNSKIAVRTPASCTPTHSPSPRDFGSVDELGELLHLI